MELVPVRIVYLEPKPGFKWSDPKANNFVDDHAFNKLKMLNILPSDFVYRSGVCSPSVSRRLRNSPDGRRSAKIHDSKPAINERN